MAISLRSDQSDPNVRFGFPADDEQLLTTKIEKEWERGSDARRALDRRAIRNMLFYRGHQWLRSWYDKERSEDRLLPRNIDPNDPDAILLVTVNLIAPHVDRSIVKLTKCLSGGTFVYARHEKSEGPVPIGQLARMKPGTVQLWNGQEWATPDPIVETKRPPELIELILRSGERISCTKDHVWPTQRGDLQALELTKGDILQRTRLPEPPDPQREGLDDEDIGWLVGLYIAEGNKIRDGLSFQLHGHQEEELRWKRVRKLAEAFDGSATLTHVKGKKTATIRVYSRVLTAILDTYVSGKTSKTKCLAPAAWSRSDAFLRALLHGYLEGDGSEVKPGFWHLGFTQNRRWEQNLRTLAARLDYSFRVKPTKHYIGDKPYPGFYGTIRDHHSTYNASNEDTEIMHIRRANARRVYDVTMPGDPRYFALGSGVLSHNTSPAIETRPVSMDPDDIGVALSASRISAHEDDREHLQALYPWLLTNVFPAGVAFLRLSWNANKGRLISNPGGSDGEGPLRQGEIETTVVPHSELSIYPHDVRNIRDATRVIHSSAMTEEQIHDRYGRGIQTKGKGSSPRVFTAEQDWSVFEEQHQGSPSKRSNRRDIDTYYAVRQLLIPPGRSRANPNGLIVTASGTTILEDPVEWTDYYDELDTFPIAQCNLYPSSSWWGETWVSDLISEQMDYNLALTIERELERRIFPKGFYAEGSMNPEETSARAEWIPYDPAFSPNPPDFWAPDGSFLKQHEIVMERAMRHFGLRTGLNEAAFGDMAGSSAAATAIALQEAAAEPLAIPAKEFEACLEDFGRIRLQLIQQFWREKRMVRTQSESGVLQVRELKGSDIGGELDIRVSVESALARSKSVRGKLILEAYQASQQQSGPNGEGAMDLATLFRLLEVPNADVMIGPMMAEERLADREHDTIITDGLKIPIPSRLEQGNGRNEKINKMMEVLPQVHWWQDHPLHIRKHKQFLVSLDFYSLSKEKQAKVRALMEVHMQLHQHFMQSQAQAAQGPEGQGQPSPGGNGELLGPQGTPLQTAAGQQAANIPAATEIAMQGGRAGEPGQVPGLDVDTMLDRLGR